MAPQPSETYKIIDSGNQRKLEQVGKYIIDRPSAQAVWRPSLPDQWKKVDARFYRTRGGEGSWKLHSKFQDRWPVQVGDVKMWAKLTDFGHIGMFPEHHTDDLFKVHHPESGDFNILNLFAYTGSVSLIAAHHGGNVVHVDASKTSVAWARENAELSKLKDKPIRWIVEDVKRFCEREIRRGRKYQGIFLDPPSFGRGAKGESWKIEEDLPILLGLLSELIDDSFRFIHLSSHSPGYTPIALQNMLSPIKSRLNVSTKLSGREMTIVEQSERLLPCGACAILER